MIVITLLAAIIGYGLGAIPFAYLVLRFSQGRDIRREGTGNVGAMNAYEVSGSKGIGILIAVLDIFKGATAAGIGIVLSNGDVVVAGVAALFAVIGHNYNIFLGMRGGRGLAVAAGAVGLISPISVLLFCLMWLTGYKVIRRNIHVANVTGAIGASVLTYSAPEPLLQKGLVHFSDPLQLRFLVMMICIQILVRHIEPMRAIMRPDAPDDEGDRSE